MKTTKWIILGAVVILAAGGIFWSAKQGEKTSKTEQLSKSIEGQRAISDTLQKAVSAYDQFAKDTDNQTSLSYTPTSTGGDRNSKMALIDSLAGSGPDYDTCKFEFNDKLRKAADAAQESLALLEQSDQELLEKWSKEARLIGDWGMCYKGYLMTNETKARNGVDDLKSISLRIKGRVAAVNEAIKTQENELKEIEVKLPIFL